MTTVVKPNFSAAILTATLKKNVHIKPMLAFFRIINDIGSIIHTIIYNNSTKTIL